MVILRQQCVPTGDGPTTCWPRSPRSSLTREPRRASLVSTSHATFRPDSFVATGIYETARRSTTGVGSRVHRRWRCFRRRSRRRPIEFYDASRTSRSSEPSRASGIRDNDRRRTSGDWCQRFVNRAMRRRTYAAHSVDMIEGRSADEIKNSLITTHRMLVSVLKIRSYRYKLFTSIQPHTRRGGHRIGKNGRENASSFKVTTRPRSGNEETSLGCSAAS